VCEQLLAQRPVRRQSHVLWKRVVQGGEGAQRRGLVVAGGGVVADSFLQQAMHAHAVVVDGREAEARQRV